LLNGWSEARCQQVLQHLAAEQIIYVPTHIAATGQDLRFAKADALTVDTLQAQRYLPMPQRWLSKLMQTAGREETSEQQILADFHHAALALTKQASAEGVIVLAGTDALDAGVIHGFSLHEELQYLVLAGLSPAQALYSATLGPAKAFGMSSTLGAIEAGMLADLVLLSADPLADITNTTKITAVIADGRLYQQQEREQALNYVEEQAHTVTLISRFLRGLWFDATPSEAN
jgi:imidazolonepropionase-like amidohydrolase